MTRGRNHGVAARKRCEAAGAAPEGADGGELTEESGVVVAVGQLDTDLGQVGAVSKRGVAGESLGRVTVGGTGLEQFGAVLEALRSKAASGSGRENDLSLA